MSEREKLIKADQEKSINIISRIDDFWLLNQFYRLLVNVTKGTKYEALVLEKDGVADEQN